MSQLTMSEAKAVTKFILEHAPDYDWDLAIREGDWTGDERDALDNGYFNLLEETWPNACPSCGRNPALEQPPAGKTCHER